MVFTIYSHGGHLGYMTWTIYISFHLLFLTMLHIKVGQVVSEKKIFEYYGRIHVYSPGAGADNPLRTFFPT